MSLSALGTETMSGLGLGYSLLMAFLLFLGRHLLKVLSKKLFALSGTLISLSLLSNMTLDRTPLPPLPPPLRTLLLPRENIIQSARQMLEHLAVQVLWETP